MIRGIYMVFATESGKRRRIAGLLALMLISIIIGASALEMAEAEHECCGEDCAVCMCLRTLDDAKAKLGAGLTPQTVAGLPAEHIITDIRPIESTVLFHTLVDDKIRMDT